MKAKKKGFSKHLKHLNITNLLYDMSRLMRKAFRQTTIHDAFNSNDWPKGYYAGLVESFHLIKRHRLENQKRNRGFSLIELIIAMGLAIPLIFVGYQFIEKIMRSAHQDNLKVAMYAQSRDALTVLHQLLLRTDPQSLIIDTPEKAPPNSRLQFTLFDGTSYLAWLENRQLLLKNLSAGTFTSLADNMTFILFTGDSTDPSYINISMRLDRPDFAKPRATIFVPKFLINVGMLSNKT